MDGGVYDAFYIGIGPIGVNPLDYVAGRKSAGPGKHWHHIMTNKNFKAGLQWSVKYEKLFKRYKITGNPFSWTENLVALPNHQGPHPDKYHAKIYKMVEAAAKSPGTPAEKETAVRNKLAQISRELKTTGGKAYDLKRPGRR